MRWNKLLIGMIKVFAVIIPTRAEYYWTGYIEVGLFTCNLGSPTLSFLVSNVNQYIWDGEFTLTNKFQNASLLNIPHHMNYNIFSKYGWAFCNSAYPTYAVIWDTLGFAKYKIVAFNEEHQTRIDSFYLDWRDDRYPYFGITPDFGIKYDGNASPRFSFCRIAELSSENWIPIQSGTTISIWDILEESNPPGLSHFQPTNPTGLTVTKVNNHPKLTWTPSSAPSSGPK